MGSSFESQQKAASLESVTLGRAAPASIPKIRWTTTVYMKRMRGFGEGPAAHLRGCTYLLSPHSGDPAQAQHQAYHATPPKRAPDTPLLPDWKPLLLLRLQRLQPDI